MIGFLDFEVGSCWVQYQQRGDIRNLNPYTTLSRRDQRAPRGKTMANALIKDAGIQITFEHMNFPVSGNSQDLRPLVYQLN